MELRVEIVQEHKPAVDRTEFVEQLHPLLLASAGELDLPRTELLIVLTGDLVASVRTHSPNEPDFQPERLGGTVAAKTIGVERDFSKAAIIVGVDDDEADSQLMATMNLFYSISILAHEFGHVILGRLRAIAGTRPPRPVRAQSLLEAGSILAFEAADEYRCDLFADGVLNHIRMGIGDEEPSTLSIARLRGTAYEERLEHVLGATVHPGWPDVVQSYRTRHISLDQLHRTLILEGQEVLKLIAHAEATAVSAGRPAVLSQHENHPAVQLYLGDAWRPIRAVLNETATIPAAEDFAKVDRSLQGCGQHIEAMWKRLGFSSRITESDQLWLDVVAPIR